MAKRKFIASKWDQKWRPKLCEIQFTFTSANLCIVLLSCTAVNKFADDALQGPLDKNQQFFGNYLNKSAA